MDDFATLSKMVLNFFVRKDSLVFETIKLCVRKHKDVWFLGVRGKIFVLGISSSVRKIYGNKDMGIRIMGIKKMVYKRIFYENFAEWTEKLSENISLKKFTQEAPQEAFWKFFFYICM